MAVLISSLCIIMFTAGGFAPSLAQQTGTFLAQPQPNLVNPCATVNCGINAVCVPVPNSARLLPSARYRCVTITLPSAIPQCYDEVIVQVPVASAYGSGSQSSLSGLVGRPACQNNCPNGNRDCGRGQSCCIKGCDRVCYTPKVTVIGQTSQG